MRQWGAQRRESGGRARQRERRLHVPRDAQGRRARAICTS
jgi:hypothetical protein